MYRKTFNEFRFKVLFNKHLYVSVTWYWIMHKQYFYLHIPRV